ncbi:MULTISPECIES: hypothetical protein [unclassified Pseudomonas]|uniref:hypothetical protein n=1 Tax=unclassified Pseudomonas TaxID=196821 RepID=UPI000A1EC65A|nr:MULTISPECIES: hypothetical protein [unclassified Pseudomonas]
MSNETISVPRELAELCFRALNGGRQRLTGMEHGQAFRELRELLAQPADAGISASLSSLPRFDMDQTACEIQDPDGVWVRYDDVAAFLQHQGEPVAWEVQYRDDGVHQGFVTTQERANYYGKQAYKIVPLYTRPGAQPAPAAVVLPERQCADHFSEKLRDNADGWNACLDEVARLNPPQQ